MAETEIRPTIKDAMANSLEVIDRMLAQVGTPLPMRPLSAATRFVELYILKVDEVGDGEGQPPGAFADYGTSRWFREIYKFSEDWYHDRFGDAIRARQHFKGLDAATLICDTPYLMQVPMTTFEAGTHGESIWLCYHDAVQSGEDVLSWVQDGPIIDSLARKDAAIARQKAVEIATKFRATHVALLGMHTSDPKASELRNGIFASLEGAAHRLVQGRPENVKLAHWDMQMACELALKSLSQERAGTFKETHDLFYLYDNMPDSFPPFARTELSKLPNWGKMVELRYNGGPLIGILQAFRSYSATMTIVAATTCALKKRYDFGKAKFHIKRPPWMDSN